MLNQPLPNLMFLLQNRSFVVNELKEFFPSIRLYRTINYSHIMIIP